MASKHVSKVAIPTMKEPLTPRQRAQLRGVTFCDERTIKRWWAGARVHPAIAQVLQGAAKSLGISA